MPNQQSNLEKKPKFNPRYILIVLILVILVGGGILAYQYHLTLKEKVKTPARVEQTEKVSPPPPFIATPPPPISPPEPLINNPKIIALRKLDFGAVDGGRENSKRITYSIRNDGGKLLELKRLPNPGLRIDSKSSPDWDASDLIGIRATAGNNFIGFYIPEVIPDQTINIYPGGQEKITIIFSPAVFSGTTFTKVGKYADTVRFSTNDPMSPMFDIELFGKGIISISNGVNQYGNNVYVSNSYSITHANTFKQLTERALAIFSDQYKNIVNGGIFFLNTAEYQDVLRREPLLGSSLETSLAYTGPNQDIYINGDALLQGISVFNPDNYTAADGPEDIIIHEVAHIVLRVCSCRDAWIQVKTADILDGVVSQYALDNWLLAEVFPETVVGYQNSGGDSAKIFNDSRNREALSRKFQFLEEHNIVEKTKY